MCRADCMHTTGQAYARREAGATLRDFAPLTIDWVRELARRPITPRRKSHDHTPTPAPTLLSMRCSFAPTCSRVRLRWSLRSM